MIVNRVDVEKFKETVEKTRKDPATGKKTMEIEGEWRIGKTGPQPCAVLHLRSDSLYGATFAKWEERCPGYYCVTHEIFPEIKIVKQ